MAKNKWGVVPYRKKKGKVEVLVITTRNDNWGLPKGNFIKKLGARRTALREAFDPSICLRYDLVVYEASTRPRRR